MECDDKRLVDAEDDVVIEPVPRVAFLHQPAPVLTQRVKEDDQEHEHAQPSQLDADEATGAQGCVLGRERAVRRTQRVVIKTVDRQCKDQGRKKKVSSYHAGTMPALAILNWRNRSCDRSVSAHFSATFSSVLTENLL